MKRLVRTTICFFFSVYLMLSCIFCVQAAPDVSAPSYLLMEASTGQIICEQEADVRRSPASITKIMTLLLIFDHLDTGRIKLEDEIITSAYAKSMGGSQVFLEEGEVQTLDTMIKCIAVASGNDACVAVAEYIAGSEEEFVKLMNQKAEELRMDNTHFVDCCGLSDSDEHYTTARDVAIMSRELVTKHPEILNYTKIWMEDITHVTRQGSTTFTLSSTNKLLRQYEWTTGLKTGSTSKAKYCLSATASKDGIDLIAVVMAAPDNKVRFQDAMALLNFGYSVSNIYIDENKEALPAQKIKGGVEDMVNLSFAGEFRYLDTKGSNLSKIEKTITLPEEVVAPVEEGQAIGEAVYKLDGQRIGGVSIVAAKSIGKAGYKDYVKKVLRNFLL
ncbi:MAG: D-alanyl-D-alanine carboxypeptidase [Lachnospiraceae bacterium]|nr:D-alanyl-D-alanine carboxypeptidase [Lachnospiraceae bacterium]